MKKIYTSILILVAVIGSAQVANPGFEEKRDDGVSLKNWGAFYPLTMTMNPETGEWETPNIFFDFGSDFSFGIPDCWTGSSAMHVSNAFNMTNNQVIPGFARLFNSELSEIPTGWNYGIPVPADANIQIFGFDVKYSPAGNDVARAWIEIYDSESEIIGSAQIFLTSPIWDFQYVYTPLSLTPGKTPAFMNIGFDMSTGTSEVNWGSWMIVDNVKLNWSSLANPTQTKESISVFPTLADSEINLLGGDEVSGKCNLAIIDVNGRTVLTQHLLLSDSPSSVDVSGLSKGVYILKADAGNRTHTTRFIKK